MQVRELESARPLRQEGVLGALESPAKCLESGNNLELVVIDAISVE
jgi:hypothetical protein